MGGSRLLAAIDRVDDWIGALALALCVGTVLLAVGARDLFGTSFLWTDEMARYFIIWAAYFGASAAIRSGGHIRVELFIDRLPVGARRVIETLVWGASAAVTAALTWSGYKYVSDTLRFGVVSAESNLAIPIWIFQLAIPVAFAIMTVRLAVRTWHVAQGAPIVSDAQPVD